MMDGKGTGFISMHSLEHVLSNITISVDDADCNRW